METFVYAFDRWPRWLRGQFVVVVSAPDGFTATKLGVAAFPRYSTRVWVPLHLRPECQVLGFRTRRWFWQFWRKDEGQSMAPLREFCKAPLISGTFGRSRTPSAQ